MNMEFSLPPCSSEDQAAKTEDAIFRSGLKQRFWAEMFGTFVVVFAGCGAAAVDSISFGRVTHLGIALAFGLAVMVMTFTFGGISGAHLNPAITIAFAVTRKFPKQDMIPYLAAQFLGAITAWVLLFAILRPVVIDLARIQGLLWRLYKPITGSCSLAFTFEFLLSMMMMTVVSKAADAYCLRGPLAGLAAGAVVTLGALFAGPLGGGNMNPARSLGPVVMGGNVHFLPIYLIGPIVGAVVGGVIYEYLSGAARKK